MDKIRIGGRRGRKRRRKGGRGRRQRRNRRRKRKESTEDNPVERKRILEKHVDRGGRKLIDKTVLSGIWQKIDKEIAQRSGKTKW